MYVSKLDYKLDLDYMTLIVMHTITMQPWQSAAVSSLPCAELSPEDIDPLWCFRNQCSSVGILCFCAALQCSSQNAILHVGSGCLGQEETYCKFPLNG